MCNLPHTASALDAAGHNGFDERADVLVLHSSFALGEAAPVTAKLHGLVLQTKWYSVVLVNLTLNSKVKKTTLYSRYTCTGFDYIYL